MQPVPDLATMLGSIRWVIVGGLALRAYIPERMTLDVDILVHERDAGQARQAFLAAGYHVIAELTIGGFTVQPLGAETPVIDIITRADNWLDQALLTPGHDPAGYPVLGRPYLTLMKLQAGRTQDLADVQRLIASAPAAERAITRELVLRESPELVEDFDALCTLADLEFGPPSGSELQ
ncbi:MAG: hypothetical protein OHK0015_41790 [Chloroflexi bacterium OHK40]